MSARMGRQRRRALADGSAEGEAQSPAAVWRGMQAGRFRPLSQSDEAAVFEGALSLLEDLGLSQPNSSMIDLVTSRGGQLTSDGRLLFPSELVNWAIEGANRNVTLYARRAGWDLDLSSARLHFSTGGGAPAVCDIDTGQYRPGTAQDLYDAARLVDALENVHHFSRSIVVRDANGDRALDINTAYCCLAGTDKHVSISVTEPDNVADIADICYALAGGEAAFRSRPFLTVMVCHVVPPMRFATDACETLEAAVRAGFPVQIISAGQAGATSPASVAGSLVQAVAETLAGFTFARLVDPDVAAIFAPKPLVADLRTGAMCGGGGEPGDPDGGCRTDRALP